MYCTIKLVPNCHEVLSPTFQYFLIPLLTSRHCASPRSYCIVQRLQTEKVSKYNGEFPFFFFFFLLLAIPETLNEEKWSLSYPYHEFAAKVKGNT